MGADYQNFTDDGTSKRKQCPEKSASFLSRVFFHWYNPLVWMGYKNPLKPDDIWSLNNDHYVQRQSADFNKHLDEEFSSSRPGKKGSIVRALRKTYWCPFAVGTFCKLVSDLLVFAQPILMKSVLRFLQSDDSPWYGVAYAFAMLLCGLIQTCFSNYYFHTMYAIGMHAKAVVIAAVYEKSLRLSSGARRNQTVGQIVNLMSNDAQKFLELMSNVSTIWSGPLQIILALAIISVDMGTAVFAGTLVLLSLVPFTMLLSSKQRNQMDSQMKDKDRRIKVMSEILNGIKILKLYAWELGFKQVVDAIRIKELSKIVKIGIFQAFLNLSWSLAPFFASLATFGAFVLINPNRLLTADIAFVTLAVYQNLRYPLIVLPNVVALLIQTRVAVKRLNAFLAAEELDGYVTKESSSSAIQVQNGSFTWEDDSTTLHDINIRIQKGDLVAVVGQVGTGKSSLVSAILGDMKLISGSVNVSGRIAYVSQQAWLRNATIRENILFGKPYQEEKYWDVLRRCAMIEDLRTFPAGDHTEIGEKGINLSGGQKQRISIARAVYSDADIYLLDDPLSALDSHVGAHVFREVIGRSGILKSKTRLLVTHGIQYLPKVNRVVVLKNGRIAQAGSYDDLMNAHDDFRKLIQEFSQQEEPEITEEEVEKSQKEEGSKIAIKESKAEVSNGKITKKEHAETGGVKIDVYQQYTQYFGVIPTITVILSVFAVNAFQVGSSFWLADWSQDRQTSDTESRLGIYGSLGLGQAVFLFISVILTELYAVRAARRLHERLLLAILHSPMSFFDTTPSGRIVNRFARDVDIVDLNLAYRIRIFIEQLLQLCATLFVICFNFPTFLAIIIPLSGIYYFIQILYISSSRQIRRIEANSRSPIYSHFSETIQGTSVIRAFGSERQFCKESNETIDENQTCYYSRICGNRWLAIRLDICGTLITFFTCLLIVLSRGNVDAGVAGLCLTYALTALNNLSALVRSSVDVEVNLVSVERILEYVSLESEDVWHHNSPPDNWPSEGAVEFKNYSTRYRNGLPLVVRSINMKISPGEKLGICGRTGAGKSSLTLALFRIIEATEGEIVIDGQSIGSIGLHDLRKKLSIIPQDPVLFSGTLRLNLDPFDSKSDEDLWDALEHAHLKNFVGQLDKGLNAEVAEGGQNFSVGQRQLVCLARALLRKTRILVLDEATAAVDVETDSLIQKTIQNEFADCTVITIAHRVNTIFNYDKILVLDEGKLCEFDSPSNLLDDPYSLFSSIVNESKAKC